MPDPRIDPAAYAALLQDEGQQPQTQTNDGGQQPQMQATMTPEEIAAAQAAMQMQAAQMQQAPAGSQPDTEDQLEEAKRLLGLDQTQEQLQAMQERLRQMELEKTEAELRAKFPDVPKEAVEQEIERIKKSDPNFAESLMATPAGLEMAYRAAAAAMKPKEAPDVLTDEGGAGAGGEDDIVEKVRTGKADDFTLGQYILGLGG
ncbi:hypothetical protein [Nitratifractor sp.]